MPKIAYVGVFLPFSDPLHTIKTFSARIFCKIFPQEFPTRFPCKEFPTRISHKISPQEFQHDFPARISHKNFPQDFLATFSCKIFQQDFPARISQKIFPKDFPTRFSHKIFLSWILIGWLPITLLQMLNFHQSLPFLNWLIFSLSEKIFLQKFPARI